jgi:hypothetical protein
MGTGCALADRVVSRPRAQTRIICLKRGKVARLEKDSGVKTIETKAGVLWLTGTPADGDVLLQNAGRFDLRDRWPYIIEALEAAELLLFL